MTRLFDDDLSEAEYLTPSVRSREEWDYLFRTLDAPDETVTLAKLPDFEPVLVGEGPERYFIPARDLPRAMREAEDFSWGSLNVGDPIVVAALKAAEVQEYFRRQVDGFQYRCDACLSDKDLTTFTWAGALFVHLLTCPRFKKAVE